MHEHEPLTDIAEQSAGAPAHPEEIRASAVFRIGDRISLTSSGMISTHFQPSARIALASCSSRSAASRSSKAGSVR